ncbi:MAG: DNA primase [Thermodesulfobacteriota bacterium]|nr:DNA primase [Thermodesulfobacteriota bacterium]
MAFQIPDDKIADIKNAADIVDIISEAVLLKKSGRNYLGLCPFHSEKTPSFTVSPDKQIFHCFGCGEGGNVFNFLMKHQGLSFPEAVKLLARRCGIDLPSPRRTPAQKKAISEKETLLEVNRQAAQFFRDQFNGTGGEAARQYLTKRGFSEAVIETFQIGYAPDQWEGLTGFFKGKKVSLEAAEKAGLIIPGKRGGYYDRFRGRIIFPITDVAGRIIGFGGRVLDDSLPKYLNSPETPLYNKRRTLYGLGWTKQACRRSEKIYITEGYTDLLALYKAGIKNVVATLGTSLTDEHVRLLKGYAAKAILVFDSDEAGVKAARRSIDVFNREKGVDPFILVLPEGHDPDSYMRGHGADAFEERAGNAYSAIAFLIESAISTHGLSVEGKVKVVGDMSEPLSALDDPLARSLYVKELAERIGVSEAAVMDRVKLLQGDESRGRQVRNGAGANAGNAQTAAGTADISAAPPIELQIVAMMIHVPETINEIESRRVLDFFTDEILKSTGMLILKVHKQHRQTVQGGPDSDSGPDGYPVEDLSMHAENDTQKQLITALTVGNELFNWDKTGCRKLIHRFVSSRCDRDEDLSRRIKTAAEQNDSALLDALLREKQEQIRNRRSKIVCEGENAL